MSNKPYQFLNTSLIRAQLATCLHVERVTRTNTHSINKSLAATDLTLIRTSYYCILLICFTIPFQSVSLSSFLSLSLYVSYRSINARKASKQQACRRKCITCCCYPVPHSCASFCLTRICASACTGATHTHTRKQPDILKKDTYLAFPPRSQGTVERDLISWHFHSSLCCWYVFGSPLDKLCSSTESVYNDSISLPVYAFVCVCECVWLQTTPSREGQLPPMCTRLSYRASLPNNAATFGEFPKRFQTVVCLRYYCLPFTTGQMVVSDSSLSFRQVAVVISEGAEFQLAVTIANGPQPPS